MKTYALHRADSGLLATRVALVHKGRVARPVLAVDTGALYTVVEPAFLVSIGLELTRPEAIIDVVGIGGRLRLPCFGLERLYCFGAGPASCPGVSPKLCHNSAEPSRGPGPQRTPCQSSHGRCGTACGYNTMNIVHPNFT